MSFAGMVSPYEGMVVVNVERASGLLPMDPNGLSDPYCILGFVSDKNERLNPKVLFTFNI